jgi:Hint domain
VPTTYTDQFFILDPATPPPIGTVLTFQRLDFIDQNDDGLIGSGTGDTFENLGAPGMRVINVWDGDTVTLIMNGIMVELKGVTFYVDNGAGGSVAVFTPLDGTILSNAEFVRSTFVTVSTQVDVGAFGPACFVRGTMILTDKGERAIETLAVGDIVMTVDHGPQPLRWIGKRKVAGWGNSVPIRFQAGALGNVRDLIVSPQHRMLVSGWRAELMFGQPEVLVAAKHLVNGDTIHEQPMPEVEYWHILLDRHELVMADGTVSESFHPGTQVLAGDAEMRAELAMLFPELSAVGTGSEWPLARRTLRAHEALLLVSESA